MFDCDGVILNSNGVKREAMYQSALSYGAENASRLAEFHGENGGISRELKFRWFLSEIMGFTGSVEEKIAELKRTYRKHIWSGLLNCEEAAGIREILVTLRSQEVSLLVVSGAEQDELREILEERDLARMFDGVYGAPNTKDEILARETDSGAIIRPSIFFGDSRYDYEAASRAGLDFVFVYGWTDVVDWRSFVVGNGINATATVADALRPCG